MLAFLMTGAAGTEYVFAVTCGEVSTTSAEVASARALTTEEIRRRRERPWVFEADVCVITGGYSHTIGYEKLSNRCGVGVFLLTVRC